MGKDAEVGTEPGTPPLVSWWDTTLGHEHEPVGDKAWRQRMAEAERTIDERYQQLESAEERLRERKRAAMRAKEREIQQRAAAARAAQLKQDPGALSGLAALKPAGGGAGASKLTRMRAGGGSWAKVRSVAGTDGADAQDRKKLRASMVERLRVAKRPWAVAAGPASVFLLCLRRLRWLAVDCTTLIIQGGRRINLLHPAPRA